MTLSGGRFNLIAGKTVRIARAVYIIRRTAIIILCAYNKTYTYMIRGHTWSSRRYNVMH